MYQTTVMSLIANISNPASAAFICTPQVRCWIISGGADCVPAAGVTFGAQLVTPVLTLMGAIRPSLSELTCCLAMLCSVFDVVDVYA